MKIEECHTGGRGSEKWQNSLTYYLNGPLLLLLLLLLLLSASWKELLLLLHFFFVLSLLLESLKTKADSKLDEKFLRMETNKEARKNVYLKKVPTNICWKVFQHIVVSKWKPETKAVNLLFSAINSLISILRSIVKDTLSFSLVSTKSKFYCRVCVLWTTIICNTFADDYSYH